MAQAAWAVTGDAGSWEDVARATGLEPATSGVTGGAEKQMRQRIVKLSTSVNPQ